MFFDCSKYKNIHNFRYEFFNTIGSTSDECIKRALSGDSGNLWIVASRQTDGRGRMKKKWVSDKGNIYSSLLLIDSISKDYLTLLPFAIAVAVHSTISSVLPIGADVKIKWPNDLLVSQRKISGILIETLKLENGLHAIIIGIGLNFSHSPSNNPYPVTSLKEEGCCLDLKDVFPVFFQDIAKMLNALKKDKGREEIMKTWRFCAHGIGNLITVNLPHGFTEGRFAGVDDLGYLLLEEETGCIRKICTGDIFI
ncbi:biotin--[acetyl-CoA-carboxylase] ligase [Candidatus Liberibacter brunswickensis]|uniref:biotin--[acetyl-CoA-carboxylase] ligase n=1 Tax=Candidatus Liberibacter brunswickensis TaxID=1968796 RepID=UPI002FE0F7C1